MNVSTLFCDWKLDVWKCLLCDSKGAWRAIFHSQYNECNETNDIVLAFFSSPIHQHRKIYRIKLMPKIDSNYRLIEVKHSIPLKSQWSWCSVSFSTMIRVVVVVFPIAVYFSLVYIVNEHRYVLSGSDQILLVAFFCLAVVNVFVNTFSSFLLNELV